MIGYKKLKKFLKSLFKIKPSFIIIGVQKGGTTSLFNYLAQHPSIEAPSKKEIHFFDDDESYQKGIGHYHSQFPFYGFGKITGEATPYYIFSPNSLERIKKYNSKLKFIIVLRDPIERAYSHFKMIQKRGLEDRSFEKCVIDEIELIKENKINTKDIDAFTLQHKSYVSRGLYLKQLELWTKAFDKKQFFITKSEDLFSSPQEICYDILRFLNINSSTYPKNYSFINYFEGSNKENSEIEPVRNLLKKVYKEDLEGLKNTYNINFLDNNGK